MGAFSLLRSQQETGVSVGCGPRGAAVLLGAPGYVPSLTPWAPPQDRAGAGSSPQPPLGGLQEAGHPSSSVPPEGKGPRCRAGESKLFCNDNHFSPSLMWPCPMTAEQLGRW